MIAVGFLFFVYFLYKNPKRIQLISDEKFLNLLFIGLTSGIIGGRLIFVIYDWELFRDNFWQVFYPWVGGFGILGSVIGVLFSCYIFLKKNKINFLKIFDLVGVYAGLLEGFGRIGCFLAGCCYGKIADASCTCSVVFKNPEGLAPLNIPLHPTQLYSSLASFLIFLIIYFRSKYFSYKNGEIIFSYLLLFSLSRIIIDFFRGDRDFVNNFYLLSYYQLIAIVVFIVSLISIIYIRIKK
jgi:phosphatidylglycerol:prolipoprotein diacylglycerol transferase